LRDDVKARVDNFEVLLKSRFPSAHERLARPWAKVAGQILALGRWRSEDYSDPRLLRRLRQIAVGMPDDRQAYGHLRQTEAA
jgi:hypothetical protein